jgi:acyl-CoA reductase-like NAD-dependent aldehyde dehydrogenase
LIDAMSVETITTVSPITNKPIVTRNGLSDADLKSIPDKATWAFESYRRTPLSERQKIVKKALKLLDERQDDLGKEITEQMGRPISYTPKEITTAVARGEYLVNISEEALKDTEGEAEKGFQRYIKKVPIGPVLILFPWNVCCWWRNLYSTPHVLTAPAVSVPYPCELDSTSLTRRQLSHSKTFATDSNKRRAGAARVY